MSAVASAIFTYSLYFSKLGMSRRLVVCPSCSTSDWTIYRSLTKRCRNCFRQGRLH
jgi:hypothetical protein